MNLPSQVSIYYKRDDMKKAKKRQNESALACVAQRGDKEALQLLLTRNWAWLKGLVYSIVGNADEIDDGKRFPSRPPAPPFGPGERGPPLEKKQIFSTYIATLECVIK